MNLIKTRIVPQSGRYIPFIKPIAQPSPNKRESKFLVQMRVSSEDLRQILLRSGLLYQMDGPPKILPMVTFIDRQNVLSQSWWTQAKRDADPFLLAQASFLSETLKKSFSERGFFALNPVEADYRKLLPDAFQVENPGTDDLLFLAGFFKAQVLVRGDVRISPLPDTVDVFQLWVRLTAYQTGNSRVIGETTQQAPTARGAFQGVVAKQSEELFALASDDLARQIADSWQKGTFGTSLVRIELRGDLTYQATERIKRGLTQLADIKTLRERLFEPDRITFEADVSSAPAQLAESLRRVDFNPLKVEVVGVAEGRMELRVRGRL
jgi:hypothetical protein